MTCPVHLPGVGAEHGSFFHGRARHDFARRAILDALALGPEDRLLEIGCGGGLLLRDALAFGASATGIVTAIA